MVIYSELDDGSVLFCMIVLFVPSTSLIDVMFQSMT